MIDEQLPSETLDCDHPDFRANVNVCRLSDSGRFVADIRIRCSACGRPFQFRGLPLGLNTDGASMSIDGLEAHIAIVPLGKQPPEYHGPTGFTVQVKGVQ